MFEIGMIDQIWQLSQEHKICKCISYACLMLILWLLICKQRRKQNNYQTKFWNWDYLIILKLNTVIYSIFKLFLETFCAENYYFSDENNLSHLKNLYSIIPIWNHEIWQVKRHKIHVLSYHETWHVSYLMHEIRQASKLSAKIGQGFRFKPR